MLHSTMPYRQRLKMGKHLCEYKYEVILIVYAQMSVGNKIRNRIRNNIKNEGREITCKQREYLVN